MLNRIPTVTASVQTDQGVYTTRTIREAWYRDKGISEAESSQGGYLVQAYEWFYPREVNGTLKLLPGDVITHAGVSYTVGPDGTVEVGAQGAYKCSTLSPQFNQALTDTISVKRYAAEQDAAGYLKKGATFTYVVQNIPCKIQVADTFGIVAVGVSEILGKQQSPVLANIFVSSTFQLQPHDEIIDGDGNKYTFEADANVRRLGQFQSLQCRRLL
jgi:hypothetical protein